jgi:hypothetical protein
MHSCVSFLRRQCSLILESILANRSFNLKKLQYNNVYVLLIALCLASGAASAQSTVGQGTVNIAIDDNNCSYHDPNGIGPSNSGTISITINNTETESQYISA